MLGRLRRKGLRETVAKRITGGELKAVVGISAGAMIMGEKVIIGHKEVKRLRKGLNVLPEYVIDSHFSQRQRQDRLSRVLEEVKGKTGLGLDEFTNLVIDSKDFSLEKVFGEGSLTVMTNRSVKTYDSSSKLG